MTELMRVRVQWTGWGGGPGVSTHFLTGTDPAPGLTALNNFYDAVHYGFPSGITVTVLGEGDIIEDTTGALTGQWQHGSDTAHTGGSTTKYTSAMGMQVRWNTSAIHNGRRLAGRTFLVPMTTDYLGANGLYDTTNTSATQSAANSAISAATGTLAVWGRPRKATATLGAAPGTHGDITTATVPTKPVVLRSRRD